MEPIRITYIIFFLFAHMLILCTYVERVGGCVYLQPPHNHFTQDRCNGRHCYVRSGYEEIVIASHTAHWRSKNGSKHPSASTGKRDGGGCAVNGVFALLKA